MNLAISLHGATDDVRGRLMPINRSFDLAALLAAVKRYPLASLQVGWRTTYDVHANWKLIAENYNECYHCAGVHPELWEHLERWIRGHLAPATGAAPRVRPAAAAQVQAVDGGG